MKEPLKQYIEVTNTHDFDVVETYSRTFKQIGLSNFPSKFKSRMQLYMLYLAFLL